MKMNADTWENKMVDLDGAKVACMEEQVLCFQLV